MKGMVRVFLFCGRNVPILIAGDCFIDVDAECVVIVIVEASGKFIGIEA